VAGNVIHGGSLAGALELPPPRALELLGQYTCDLPESSRVGLFQIPVRGGDKIAFEYRESGRGFEIVLLVRKDEPRDDRCQDRILSFLILPRHAVDSAINFDCRLRDGSFHPRERLIGIVRNQKRVGEYGPVMAWVVNLDDKSFRRADRARVTCLVDNYYKDEFAGKN
jgi:hypothetical protein